MTHTLDDYVSDDAQEHRERLAIRNELVIRAANCPRCGSTAGAFCLGTMGDGRHAGEELTFGVHVDRLIVADLPQCGAEEALNALRAARAELLLTEV